MIVYIRIHGVSLFRGTDFVLLAVLKVEKEVYCSTSKYRGRKLIRNPHI